MREINQAGLDLIKSEEQKRLNVYRDANGYLTCGYGHKCTEADGFEEGDVISEDEANQFLADDLVIAENAVENLVKVRMTDNEFSALVSFTYNVGAGAFAKSTLLRELNAGAPLTQVADQLQLWCHDHNGNVLQGLVRRRDKEMALFLSPVEAEENIAMSNN